MDGARSMTYSNRTCPRFAVLLIAATLAAGCRDNRSSDHADSPSSIVGHVTVAGKPATGARVRIKGRSHSAITNKEGRFLLPRPVQTEDPAVVTASKEGYYIRGQEVGPEPLELQLRPLPTHDNQDYAWVPPAPDERKRNESVSQSVSQLEL